LRYDAAMTFLVGAAVVIAGGVYASKHPTFALWWIVFWVVADVVTSAACAARHNWGYAVVMAVSAVITALWGWNRWRNRRKRAPRSYGAKSWALVAAIVARARAAVRSRPLDSVPGGA
jgi:hypothetical protein